MKKNKKINTLLDIKFLNPNKSEWFGFYENDGETETLNPKSFGNLIENGKYLNDICSGLFYVLSNAHYNDEEFCKNMKFIEGNISLDKVSSQFTDIYIFLILKTLYDKLTNKNYFFYDRTIENTSKIRGRIDFVSSTRKNHGLLHKHICNFNKISFHFPLLSLIRHFFRYFSTTLAKADFVGEELKKEIRLFANNIDNHLSACNDLPDYYHECINVISDKYTFDTRFASFIPELIVLSNIYISNPYFYNDSDIKSKVKTKGLVFNLNRPFEMILRKACEEFYHDKTPEFLHDKITNFSKVISKKGNSKGLQMEPDCWFVVGNTEVILDAKHKVFIKDGFDDEDNDNNNSNLKFKREDMYQIISYAVARPNRKRYNGVYGLVGLVLEDGNSNSINDGNYVPENFHEIVTVVNTLDIAFDDSENMTSNGEIQIQLISVKFGQFLKDLGIYINHKRNGCVGNDITIPNEDAINKKFFELGAQLDKLLKVNSIYLVTNKASRNKVS